MHTYDLPPIVLCTAATVAVFIAGAGWQRTGDTVLIRVTEWEVFAVSGFATCAPAYQVTTNPDVPGPTQVIDTIASPYKAAVDVYYGEDFRNARTDATAPMKANQFWRPGWLVKLSESGSLAFIAARARSETTSGT